MDCDRSSAFPRTRDHFGMGIANESRYNESLSLICWGLDKNEPANAWKKNMLLDRCHRKLATIRCVKNYSDWSGIHIIIEYKRYLYEQRFFFKHIYINRGPHFLSGSHSIRMNEEASTKVTSTCIYGRYLLVYVITPLRTDSNVNTMSPKQDDRRLFYKGHIHLKFPVWNFWITNIIPLKCVPYLNQWWHYLLTHMCVTNLN